MRKEHPILYSTPMVQAIQEDRKTQTRRVVKEAKGWDYNWRVAKVKEEHKDGVHRYEMRCNTQYSTKTFKCHYGKVGDLLWVRETFLESGFVGNYMYKAVNAIPLNDYEKWKPSLFMPKVAARTWLEITNIKVERLQDISEEDAIAEGVKTYYDDYDNLVFKGYMDEAEGYMNAIDSYKSLWQSINGAESWNANPWVWVIEFKKTEKPTA